MNRLSTRHLAIAKTSVVMTKAWAHVAGLHGF